VRIDFGTRNLGQLAVFDRVHHPTRVLDRVPVPRAADSYAARSWPLTFNARRSPRAGGSRMRIADVPSGLQFDLCRVDTVRVPRGRCAFRSLRSLRVVIKPATDVWSGLTRTPTLERPRRRRALWCPKVGQDVRFGSPDVSGCMRDIRTAAMGYRFGGQAVRRLKQGLVPRDDSPPTADNPPSRRRVTVAHQA
jgi:hypothetical protein